MRLENNNEDIVNEQLEDVVNDNNEILENNNEDVKNDKNIEVVIASGDMDTLQLVDGKKVGFFGAVHPQVQKSLDINNTAFVFEIEMSAISCVSSFPMSTYREKPRKSPSPYSSMPLSTRCG